MLDVRFEVVRALDRGCGKPGAVAAESLEECARVAAVFRAGTLVLGIKRPEAAVAL